MTTRRRNRPLDRMVHAQDGHTQLVRYDKSGKWWLEDITGTGRTRVNLNGAVTFALAAYGKGVVHLGRAGGTKFDAKFRSALR